MKIIPEAIDKSLSNKIKSQVEDGIVEPDIVRTQLNQHVCEHCQPPPNPTNKRFYPATKTIRNHVYMAKNTRLQADQQHVASWV
jgi:hypothetical protein